MSDRSPLRQALDAAMAETGCSMKDLTVLAPQNDPFRIDTQTARIDGEWLAMHLDRLVPARTIHLRGLHYVLVTDAPAKPNGETYRNTDKDWVWLQEKAADAARWLGYIDFARIVDQRNAEPTIRTIDDERDPFPYLHAKVHMEIPAVADIEPIAMLHDFTAQQPYRIVLIGEKSSLGEVLSPVAERYGTDLYLPTGCMSDTLIHKIAKTGAEDGRPLVVLYFADCDPGGHNMPIEVGRKLQALKVGFFPELEFQEYRVALTVEQVTEYGLPSTPLKDTEKRADKWRSAFGVEQTEIDALASLRPDLLRRIAANAIAPFYDRTLHRRIHEAREDWHHRAQEVVDAGLDHDLLERFRGELQGKLDSLRDEINAVNDALRIDASDFDLPPVPDVPQPQTSGSNGTALLDSSWSFAEQVAALKRSKGYGGAP
jgi:hypothetical protein